MMMLSQHKEYIVQRHSLIQIISINRPLTEIEKVSERAIEREKKNAVGSNGIHTYIHTVRMQCETNCKCGFTAIMDYNGSVDVVVVLLYYFECGYWILLNMTNILYKWRLTLTDHRILYIHSLTDNCHIISILHSKCLFELLDWYVAFCFAFC